MMKKFIFFVLFICCASFVHAQSSKSLGLKYSYSEHSSFRGGEWRSSSELGLVYNVFLNDRDGVIIDLSIHKTQRELNYPYSVFLPYRKVLYNYYHSSLSFHYIIRHKQWFAKSGLNASFSNLIISVHSDDVLTSRYFLPFDAIDFSPELHLGIGRDFDLGKINIRVNGFIERAFLNDNYIDFGLSTGVFYQFSE